MRNEVELCSPMKRERATLGRRERIRSEIGRRRRSLRSLLLFFFFNWF